MPQHQRHFLAASDSYSDSRFSMHLSRPASTLKSVEGHAWTGAILPESVCRDLIRPTHRVSSAVTPRITPVLAAIGEARRLNTTTAHVLPAPLTREVAREYAHTKRAKRVGDGTVRVCLPFHSKSAVLLLALLLLVYSASLRED